MTQRVDALLRDSLDRWARVRPDDVAITFGSQSFTWAQWRDRVLRLTGALPTAALPTASVLADAELTVRLRVAIPGHAVRFERHHRMAARGPAPLALLGVGDYGGIERLRQVPHIRIAGRPIAECTVERIAVADTAAAAGHLGLRGRRAATPQQHRKRKR